MKTNTSFLRLIVSLLFSMIGSVLPAQAQTNQVVVMSDDPAIVLGFRNQGLYSPTTTYAVNDVVLSAGATYYSLAAGNRAHTPVTNPSFWQVLGGSPTGSNFLPLTGGTMLGPLMLSANPTFTNQAATKAYVDIGDALNTTQLASKLPLTGGTLTGPLTLAADPTASLQPATKAYVDANQSSNVKLSPNGPQTVNQSTGIFGVIGNVSFVGPGTATTPQVPFSPTAINNVVVAAGLSPGSMTTYGPYAYVGAIGAAPAKLVVVDLRSTTVIGSYSIPGCSIDNGIQVTATQAYIGCIDTNSVYILNLPTSYVSGAYTMTLAATVTGLQSTSRQMSLVGTNLFVGGSCVNQYTCPTAPALYRIDVSNPSTPVKYGPYTGTMTGTGNLGSLYSSVLSDGSFVYAANASGSQSYIDVFSASGTLLSALPVNHSPQYLALHGTSLYVTYYDANTLDVIDVSNAGVAITNKFTLSLPSDCSPIPIALRGRYAYVGCYSSGNLLQVDVPNRSIINSTHVVGGLQALAFSGRTLAVASYASGSLYTMDTGGFYATQAQIDDLSASAANVGSVMATNVTATNTGAFGSVTSRGAAVLGAGSTVGQKQVCLADGTNCSVTTVFGRAGAVTPNTGDYTVAQITGAAPLSSPTLSNVTTTGISSVSGVSISNGQMTAVSMGTSGNIIGGAGISAGTSLTVNGNRVCQATGTDCPVTTVFGRIGAVTSGTGDYTVSQITGAAPLSSPSLTGSPTAPTPTIGDNSGKIATTGFVTAAIAASPSGTVTSISTSGPITGGPISSTGTIACPTCVTASSPSAGVAHFPGSSQAVTSSPVNLATEVTGVLPLSGVAGAAGLASPAFTGTPTAPTASPGTNTTQVANTAFVTAAVAASTAGVSTFIGRTGAVTAQSGDYSVGQISGAAPLASPALTGSPTVNSTAICLANGANCVTPSYPVTSVMGRTGAVTSQSGDYSVGQVTGAAPLASPAITGSPTVNGNSICLNTGSGCPSATSASVVFTATLSSASSDTFSFSGITSGMGCVFSPTNSTAVVSGAGIYLDAPATNSITVEHASTIVNGATIMINCSPLSGS